MYDLLDENGPGLFGFHHSLGQTTFLKLLINSKNIDMVIRSLQVFEERKYYYIDFGREFVKTSIIISYLKKMSKENKNYFDIIDKLIKSGTYGMYICELDLPRRDFNGNRI